MPRRGPARIAPLAPLVLVLALGLTACGDGDEEPSASPTSASDSPSDSASTSTPSASESTETETSTPEDESLAVAVTREGDTFTPNGARVDAEVDQPVVLTITSDEPGELHVHSVPEQEITYEAGTSEHEITIGRPGVVEVESHDPDVIVLQLEVR